MSIIILDNFVNNLSQLALTSSRYACNDYSLFPLSLTFRFFLLQIVQVLISDDIHPSHSQKLPPPIEPAEKPLLPHEASNQIIHISEHNSCSRRANFLRLFKSGCGSCPLWTDATQLQPTNHTPTSLSVRTIQFGPGHNHINSRPSFQLWLAPHPLWTGVTHQNIKLRVRTNSVWTESQQPHPFPFLLDTSHCVCLLLPVALDMLICWSSCWGFWTPCCFLSSSRTFCVCQNCLNQSQSVLAFQNFQTF